MGMDAGITDNMTDARATRYMSQALKGVMVPVRRAIRLQSLVGAAGGVSWIGVVDSSVPRERSDAVSTGCWSISAGRRAISEVCVGDVR